MPAGRGLGDTPTRWQDVVSGDREGRHVGKRVEAAQYFGEEWCARARELTAGILPRRSGIDARLQYEVRSENCCWRWFQLIEDGQLRDWAVGEVADPELEIRWDLGAALAIWRQEVDGTEALARTTIATDTAGGIYAGAPPPANLGPQPSLADLPQVKGATVGVQFHLWSGPFGDVRYFISVVDGQLVGQDFGILAQPDAVIELPYRDYMRYEHGDITVLELVSMGRLEAAEGPLVTYAGLIESPEFEQAMRGCSPPGIALGALGEVAATPGYRAAMTELALTAEEP
jgi:hypothetical protein